MLHPPTYDLPPCSLQACSPRCQRLEAPHHQACCSMCLHGSACCTTVLLSHHLQPPPAPGPNMYNARAPLQQWLAAAALHHHHHSHCSLARRSARQACLAASPPALLPWHQACHAQQTSVPAALLQHTAPAYNTALLRYLQQCPAAPRLPLPLLYPYSAATTCPPT